MKRFRLFAGATQAHIHAIPLESFDDAGAALQAAQMYRNAQNLTFHVADGDNDNKVVILVRGGA